MSRTDSHDVFKQDWMDWKAHPITKEFIRRLFDKRELLKEGLAEGQASETDLYITIGRCQSLKDAIDYAISAFEVISIEEEETEQNA